MTVSIVIQLLVAGLSTGSIYALVGLGLVLAFKGTGILNFAHGELVALGAYVALFLTVLFHLPYWQVLILSLLIMALVGAVFERVLIQPLMRAPSFTVVVATMAIGLMISNALRLSWQEMIATLPSPLDNMTFRIGEVSINPQYLWIISCSILITALLALFFQKNLTGKALQAVAQNLEAAQLMGIRVSRVFPLTFAISSVLAALAGILFSPLVGIQPELGSIIMERLCRGNSEGVHQPTRMCRRRIDPRCPRDIRRSLYRGDVQGRNCFCRSHGRLVVSAERNFRKGRSATCLNR